MESIKQYNGTVFENKRRLCTCFILDTICNNTSILTNGKVPKNDHTFLGAEDR